MNIQQNKLTKIKNSAASKAISVLSQATNDATTKLSVAADNAIAKLAMSANDATKVIADAALNASKLLAVNASQAKEVVGVSSNLDHDSLTTLISAVAHLDKRFTEKFEEIKSDIRDLKDGTAQRIMTLENEKLNIRDSYPILYKKDVENRLTLLETAVDILQAERVRIVVLLSLASVAFMSILGLLITHIFK